VIPFDFTMSVLKGFAPSIDSRMQYRQATKNDLWVDDVNSPENNTWVKRGETAARSFEVMRLDDIRYRYGLVVGYNRRSWWGHEKTWRQCRSYRCCRQHSSLKD